MIVWGGYSNSEELWSFSLADRSWKKLHPLGEIPLGRGDVNGVYDPIGHRMIFVGGTRFDADGETSFREVWELDLDEPVTWRRMKTEGEQPRARFGAAYLYDPRRHRLIMDAGFFESVGSTDEIWALSLDAHPTWTLIRTDGQGPGSRYGHVAVYDSRRDRMVIQGGLSYPDPDEDAWSLSLGDSVHTWVRVAPPGPSPGHREDHVAAYDSLSDRLIVIGGRQGFFRDSIDVWAVPLDSSGSWQAVLGEGEVPPGVANASLVVVPATHELIIYGGQAGGESSSDVWRLSMESSPAWERLSPSSEVPDDMWRPNLIHDSRRDRLIVLGTTNFNPDSLAVFTLPLDGAMAWHRIRPAGRVPLGRYAASAIYDPIGDRIIVFGGVYQSNVRPPIILSDLWELSLGEAPAWKAISIQGNSVPGRAGHSTVYDPLAERMLVFGGYRAPLFREELTNTVLALSLRGSPTWSEIPANEPAPAPRAGQGMIFDSRRDRLVIYAGNGRMRFNDLWALDLRQPAWHEIRSGPDLPFTRDSFAAAYDSLGDRLVVHGGFVVTGYDWTLGRDVWAFAFSNSHWKELLPAGTRALRREYHSAIYDSRRDRMLIFGGSVWFDRSPDLWELSWGPRGLSRFVSGDLGLGGVGARGHGMGLDLTASVPSHGMPTIWFQLPSTSAAHLSVISIAGRRLATYRLDSFGPGTHHFTPPGDLHLAPGVYILHLEQEQGSIDRKIIVY